MLADYQVGDRVRIRTGTPFQNKETGTPFDPDVITFEIKPPGGPTVSYELSDDNVNKLATGDYECLYDVDLPGKYHTYLKGKTATGENRGAAQGSFQVEVKPT